MKWDEKSLKCVTLESNFWVLRLDLSKNVFYKMFFFLQTNEDLDFGKKDVFAVSAVSSLCS